MTDKQIANDGKKVLTDEEIYPPLENITLEQAYEDYAKATKEMEDTLLNEITKLREQLEHLQGEREVLLEDMQVRNNQVIEQQAEIERLNKLVVEKHEKNNELHKYMQYVKAEAIKEFAERLKATPMRFSVEYVKYYDKPPIKKMVLFIDDNDINNLVKEMVGEQK